MAYPKHRNIFRIETGNTCGWQVRIERRKKQYNKLFSDSVHGGTDEALEAALAWRDTQYEALPDPDDPAERLRTQRKMAEAMNRTGVVGIGFTMQTQKSGIKTPYVGAHWQDPETGRRRSTSFSINKHGLRGALKKACRRLREGRGEEPTTSQVNYYVRKALPAVKLLHGMAMKEERKRRKHLGLGSRKRDG